MSINKQYNLADTLLLPPRRSISNLNLARQKLAHCTSQQHIIISSYSAFKNSGVALVLAALKIDKLQTQKGLLF